MKNFLSGKKMRRVALCFTLGAGIFTGFAAYDKDDDHLFEISKNMEIFGSLFQQVNKLYVDEPKPGQLMKTGMDAMLASLDPYTNYIPAEAVEDYRYQTSGQYGGIGIVVRQFGSKFVVSQPREGYTAQKAGIKAGDVIVEVNGVPCDGKTYDDLGKLIKGVPNTPVKIKILRPGESTPRDFTILRDEVKVKNVSYSGLLDANTGYIKLTGFMDSAADEVKAALLQLKQKNITSLVLDLRGNPGGLLREAVRIVNLFVDKGQLVVSMRGRLTAQDQNFSTVEQAVDSKIPLVVLTDAWSASAAEIVAGSLQDLDRAVILGQRSFGKGLVQKTVPLVYGTMLKVTVAKYYIPSGRCIQSLDYSHRSNDGKVLRMQDSLITSYKTKDGRIVWDGLGIIPDVETPLRKYSVLTDSLIVKGLIFDYATLYAQKNASIAPADNFHLTDAEYADFVAWVKTKDYSYVTKEEKDLAKLKTDATGNGTFDALSGEYDALYKKAIAGKADDFDEFKNEIRVLLESEIASRYYYETGRVSALLKDDPDLNKAMDVLHDQKQYHSLLTTIVQGAKPKQRVDLQNGD